MEFATPFGPINPFIVLIFLGVFTVIAALGAALLNAGNRSGRRTQGRLGKIRERAAPKGGGEEVAQLKRSFRNSTIPAFDRLISESFRRRPSSAASSPGRESGSRSANIC